MDTGAQPGETPSEQPFPLKRRFWRRFVPGFVGFIGVFLVPVGLTARHVTESIYLELAQRRAQTIATAVSAHAPQPWAELMTGRTTTDLQASAEALTKAIADAMPGQAGLSSGDAFHRAAARFENPMRRGQRRVLFGRALRSFQGHFS